MKERRKRGKRGKFLWLLPIAVLTLLGSVIAVSAIEYSGEAGGGADTPASGRYTDFCLLHAGACDDNSVVGYRFSIVDISGSARGSTIDIYRDRASASSCVPSCTGGSRIYWNEYGYSGFSLLGAGGTLSGKLRNKAEAEASAPFSLEKSTRGKYKESTLGLDRALPVPSLIGSWILEEENYRTVSRLCLGGAAELNYGDIILIEPVLSCRVENCPCGLTASDLARLGLSYYGDTVPAEIDGGYGFAWLRTWVYRTFPNLLSVTDRSRAGLLGLSAGTKLLTRTKPMTILTGAYGMGMGIELSVSEEAPELMPLYVEAVRDRTVLELSRSREDTEIRGGYLESGQTYRLRVYFSEETSAYRVLRSWRFEGASSAGVFSGIGSTDDPYAEITLTLTESLPYVDLRIREDWVSEDNSIIQKGTEKVFRLQLRPSLRPEIKVYDIMDKEIHACYLGQRVYLNYSVLNASGYDVRIRAKGYYEQELEEIISDAELAQEEMLLFSGAHFRTVEQKDGLDAALLSEWKDQVYETQAQLPVYAADLELSDIRFLNAAGEELDSESLPADMPITPVLTLKNDTETPVYATVIAEGEELGTAELPSMGTVTMNAPVFVRTEEGPFSYTAELYLEGQGRSAELEKNRENNRKTVEAASVRLFCLVPTEGGPSYHIGTDVYTSVRFYNRSAQDFRENGRVRMSLYAPDGSLYLQLSGEAICPSGEDTFLYFAWHVDEALRGRCCIRFDLSADGGDSYLNSATCVFFAEIVPLPVSRTPDTVYESASPAGFTAPSLRPVYRAYSVGWHEWSLEGGGYQRRDYRVSVSGRTLIWPISGKSARKTGEGWIVRSGYGLAASLSTDILADSPLHTDFQNGYALFPEFFYRLEDRCFTSLNSEGVLEEHFMPLWYPDGQYAILMVADDLWTPAGKLMLSVPAELTVDGSLYDDRYIGR